MIEDILKKQKEFQLEVGFPILSQREADRNSMSEKYIFKAIEELIELRKEFPSSMNPWSKNQKSADIQRIHEEFSDVLLFLMNFMIVWKITPEEVLSQLKETQENNFQRMKKKKMTQLNSEILAVPGYTSGIGQGNLSPKYVFIGQNPGRSITHGYEFWSNKEDGSSKVLLPILEKLGILKDCYFTNVVKSLTPENSIPDEKTVQFWKEYLDKEISILITSNYGMEIISMGKNTSQMLTGYLFEEISHPASVMYGNIDKEQYEKEIQEIL
jgi:uracil-DNA glycosylase family 4